MVSVDVSIVTISFNQAEFLTETIESVLTQDEHLRDYVIVDPGSTDGSRDLLPHHRAVQTILEKDAGPGEGLNRGFARCTGDIFGYINADDFLLPGALAEVVRFFADNPVDVLLGSGWIVDRQSRRVRHVRSTRFTPGLYGYAAANFLQQGCFVRREAFLQSGGFNSNNHISWDAELLIDLAGTGARFRSVDIDLGAFRIYADSISGSQRLSELYRQEQDRLFAKCLHREPTAFDRLVRRCGRPIKWFVNPKIALERGWGLFRAPLS